MIVELTEENFTLFAIKYYDNPTCRGITEFENDLKRFRYLNRLFAKYSDGGGLRERLIINHIVVLSNLFGPEVVTQMLFYKIEKQYWSQLKTFLVFINILPIGIVISSDGNLIQGYEIPLDTNIIEVLGRI